MQVMHDVVSNFFSLQNNDFSSLRCKCRLDIFKAKAHQSITVFNQDSLSLRVTQQTDHALEVPIETRANFFNGINNHHLVVHRMFSQTGKLAIQTAFLIAT